MSGLTITTIIDKKAKSVKLINNHPGYDMILAYALEITVMVLISMNKST